ncbi:MAG: type 1 fimbrial protein [Neisseriaceae bacterium]|nr:type 1 fimbrial protein [Neisseriaceae bacterium]MBP6861755.1 type 1 fimbrial protein [Neisseriaceae bacterium]
MNINFLSGLGLLLWLVPALVWGGEQGRGQVDFNGEIMEVPCSIDTASLDQTIDYGVVSARSMQPLRKAFEIKLVDCQLASQVKPGYFYRKANITFYGQPAAEDPTALSVSGKAKGLTIKLLDQNQQHIMLGATHHDYELVNGDNQIRFFTELNISQQRREAGEFQALLQFIVSYL